MSADDVAAAFVNHFYTTLDSNPAGLAGLYQPQSSLTFEGTKIAGAEAIVQKYTSIAPVYHNVPALTKDVQMSVTDSSMIIVVTGQLKIGENQPLLFTQTFQLVATGPNQYYVHNDVFRLVSAL